MCGAAVGQGRGRAKAMVRWSSVHLPLVAGAQIFVAVGKTAGNEKERRMRRRVSRGEGEKKLIFKKFHFRMKRNQSAKLARSQRLEASLINLQLRDEAAVIAASQSGLNFNYRAATQLVQRIWPALCDLITSPHTIMPDRKTNNQCANFLTHFLPTWGNQQQGRNPRKKPSNANDRKNINSASHLWR